MNAKTKQNNPSRIRRSSSSLSSYSFFLFFSSSIATKRSENERKNEQRITIDRIKSEIVVMNRLNKIEFADSTLNRNMCYLVELAYLCTIHTYHIHIHITHSPPIRRMMTTATAPADHIYIHIFAADDKGNISVQKNMPYLCLECDFKEHSNGLDTLLLG